MISNLYSSPKTKHIYKMNRKPSWLKVKLNFGPEYQKVKSLLDELNLNTVCQEANCPNIGECFSAKTATFIILGNKCTRNCRFCDIKPGKPSSPDLEEPSRIAQAVKRMELKYVVLTMVTRDDLPDGGSKIFAETIRQIRNDIPECKVEALVSDFNGDISSLDNIIDATPDVIAHNLETVPHLYPTVRPQADYKRSLRILKHSSGKATKSLTKSGIMVGLGEDIKQITNVLSDAVNVGCKIFTVGQYLSP
jgi:lipoic acid synthetase